MTRKRTPFSCSLLDLLLERAQEQVHQDRDLFRRAAPVLAREREQREVVDAALDAGADDAAHRLDALAVTGDARQQPLLRPAPVAVHDDRDVARDVAGRRYVAGGAGVHAGGAGRGSGAACRCGGAADAAGVRSPSGPPPSPARTLSISAMKRSVSFCTSACACRSSSSATAWSFSSFFRCSFASRRMLRTAMRAFSASWRTTLIRSRRRSSVSAGIGTRMSVARGRRVEARGRNRGSPSRSPAPSSSPTAARRWSARRPA